MNIKEKIHEMTIDEANKLLADDDQINWLCDFAGVSSDDLAFDYWLTWAVDHAEEIVSVSTEVTLLHVENPFDFNHKKEWILVLEGSIFGKYRTKAHAVADAKEFGLKIVR